MNEKEGTVQLEIDRLFEAADRLASVPLPPLTEAEIEAEVQAVRSQRASHAGGR